jgi:c-di-GMP-binding flagellar brake protein YcgR
MSATAQPVVLDVGEHVMIVLPHVGLLPASVESVTADAITVALAVPDDRVRRLAGQDSAIERTTARGVQRYPGTLSVAGERDELLTVTLSGDVERVQRRDWARVPAAVPVKVRPLDVGMDPFETVSVNVSVGGVLIKDRWHVPLGTDVRIEIAVPDGDPVRGLGRVVREAAEDEKGIRIDDMGREDEERLMRYVRERERAELRMARGR